MNAEPGRPEGEHPGQRHPAVGSAIDHRVLRHPARPDGTRNSAGTPTTWRWRWWRCPLSRCVLRRRRRSRRSPGSMARPWPSTSPSATRSGPSPVHCAFAVASVASRRPLAAVDRRSPRSSTSLAAVMVRLVGARDDWSWFGALSWALAWAAIVAASVATGLAVPGVVSPMSTSGQQRLSEPCRKNGCGWRRNCTTSVGHELPSSPCRRASRCTSSTVTWSEPARRWEAIRATSRSSLDGLRAYSTCCGHHGSSACATAPGGRLTDIDVLVGRSRAGGVDVETSIDFAWRPSAGGRCRGVPDPAGVAHQRGAPLREQGARVGPPRGRSASDPSPDDGPVRSDANLPPGVGTGISGMRARAEDLGGTLSAGPHPGGGFEVMARLPVRLDRDRRGERPAARHDQRGRRGRLGPRTDGPAHTAGVEPDTVLVDEAVDGHSGVEVVRRVTPTSLPMDIRMPVLDGLAALREITSDPSLAGVRVIMLTTFELDEYVFEALRGGASGFVSKTPPRRSCCTPSGGRRGHPCCLRR